MLTAKPSLILIVDDKPKNLKRLFSFLQESGFTVLVTKRGETALKKLQTVSPDLILLDVALPGIDGFETCQRLKASTETKDIPVIFMTALSESMDKIKGFQVGAVDYITKPFQQEEVLARIETQLKLTKLQKQLKEQNQQLQQSQSLLAGVLNSALDGIAAFEAIRGSQGAILDFKCLLLNPAAEKIIGRTQDELVGKQLLVEVPGTRETGMFEKYVRVVETGEPLETEVYYAHETIPTWLQISAAKLDDGFTVTYRDITERKQAEAALRESEARFRGIFESAAIAIGLTGADGRLLMANPTFEAFLGYNKAEIYAADFPNITHPEDRVTDNALTQDVINGVRDSFEVEKRYIRKNGELFWGRVTVSAVRNSAGEFQFTVAILKDINDRKLRELALKESERRFQAIFNNSFQFTGLLKPNGTVIEVNQTALDFGGVKPSEVTGLPFWETCWWREGDGEANDASGVSFKTEPDSRGHSLVPPAVVKQKQLREAIATAASGQFVRYEVEVRGFRGVRATLDFSIKPVFDDAGNVVLLIPEGRDITEKKKAEERLRLLESAVVNANDAVIIAEAEPIDVPGGPKIVYVNEAFTRMTGYSPQEVIGKTPRLLQSPKTDRTQLDRIRKALLTWQSIRVELINYRKDGTEFWVEIEIVPVADETGWFTHWVSVQRDITERKQAEHKLREMTSLYQQILDAIPDLVLCKGPQSNIIYANKAFRDYYGMTQEELQGIIDAPFVNPDYTQQYVQDDADVFNTGQTLTTEEPVVRYDGQERLFSTVKSAIKDTQGQVIQTVGVSRDITEQKLAQERLRLLERAIAASNNGIIISEAKAPNNPIIYVNSGFERMTGYQKDQVIGSQCCPFERTYATPTVLDELQRALAEGRETQVTLRSSRVDGSPFWSEFCITPVRDATNHLTHFIGVQTDISDRKQVEDALRQSEERLQLALEGSGMGLWDWKINTGQIYFNSQWKTMLGYEVEEIENSFLSWERLVHPEDLPRVLEAISVHLEGRSPIYELEFRMLSKSGEWKWILSHGKVMEREPSGEPTRMTGTHLDISDRKQAEIEITAAKAALERQIHRALLLGQITQEIRSSLQPKQIFHTAATQIGQAFGVNRCIIHTYITSPVPRIPQVAEYLELGYPSMMEHEIPVIGNPHAQLALSQDQALKSHDVYHDPLLKGIADIMQELGLKSILVVRTSYQGKPNGIICLEQCDHFRYWTDDEIELLESVAVQMGIAIAQANLLEKEKQRRQELAAQNQALEKAKLEAEAANRAKSLFFSKMSHELRTPLNAILGFTQVMSHSASVTTEQTEYLEIINHSGEHLLELINDILSMSKIEAGQVTLNENRFDLYGLLNSLEEMLQLKASSKSLKLIFERTTDVPQYVQTDESKLRQVLINLLGNAIKFTQAGSVILRVRVGTGKENHSVPHSLVPTPVRLTLTAEAYSLTFEVEDTGPGIAPDELDTLFDPFVQTETGRQSMEGTGLGLSISQQFVRLMGGEISVTSQLGIGTIFTFDIQVNLATQADQKPISRSQRRVIGLEPNQQTYRILIVEDAVMNRKLLIEILKPLGFEVRTAVNGQEAVSLWESWSPHLILMDILMPVMDGYEATQQIKQLCGGNHLKERFSTEATPTPTPRDQNPAVIIALTASAFEEQREAILRAGCDDFIPKPFREEVLLEKIAHHLGVRYLYEEPQQQNSAESADFVETLTPEALAVMPTDWVEQLHQAALHADEEWMNQLIEQIPLEHLSLGRALRGLVDNFCLEQLIDLTS